MNYLYCQHDKVQTPWVVIQGSIGLCQRRMGLGWRMTEVKLADTNRYQFLALSSLSGYTNSTKEIPEWCIISFVMGTDQGHGDRQMVSSLQE